MSWPKLVSKTQGIRNPFSSAPAYCSQPAKCSRSCCRTTLGGDRERRLHVGMIAAIVFNCAGLLQNHGAGLFRRQVHVKVAVRAVAVCASTSLLIHSIVSPIVAD